MIKSRTLNNKQSFYESTTGQTLTNINSVSFADTPNTVITCVVKDGQIYVYVPSRQMKLFKLVDVVDKIGLIVERVS